MIYIKNHSNDNLTDSQFEDGMTKLSYSRIFTEKRAQFE